MGGLEGKGQALAISLHARLASLLSLLGRVALSFLFPNSPSLGSSPRLAGGCVWGNPHLHPARAVPGLQLTGLVWGREQMDWAQGRLGSGVPGSLQVARADSGPAAGARAGWATRMGRGPRFP